jgi:site-specific recombinase XerD
MNELERVTGEPNLPVAYLKAVEAAKEYLRAEKAVATRRAYRSDVAIFVAWCQALGLQALPCASETLAAFLADQAKTGSKLATLRRRVAAIAYATRPPAKSHRRTGW